MVLQFPGPPELGDPEPPGRIGWAAAQEHLDAAVLDLAEGGGGLAVADQLGDHPADPRTPVLHQPQGFQEFHQLRVPGKRRPGKDVVLPEPSDETPGAAHPQRAEAVFLLHLGGVRGHPVAVHHPVDDGFPGRQLTQSRDGSLLHPVGHLNLGVVVADGVEHQGQLLQRREFPVRPQLLVSSPEPVLDDRMAVSCEQQPSRVGEQPVVAERAQALQKFGIGGRREPAGRLVAGFPEVFPG